MVFKISIGKKEKTDRLSAFLGGLICLSLSILGLYAAFGSGTIEGGVPFFPDSFNSQVGRIVFGTGALITGTLSLYAFYECFKAGKSGKTL